MNYKGEGTLLLKDEIMNDRDVNRDVTVKKGNRDILVEEGDVPAKKTLKLYLTIYVINDII
ncbi:MAG: hypothetical protein GYA02_11070 [Clostridiaceae bacterium]|jgi:hypothetical protein|nr:hypothetical protein [Clostridiaceae bacterium]